MTMFRKAAGAAAGFIATMAVAAGPALAQQTATGAPYPWQMNFQAAATPVNELSREMTTGMSAPPMGKTKRIP